LSKYQRVACAKEKQTRSHPHQVGCHKISLTLIDVCIS
jgi:hypothetical protein